MTFTSFPLGSGAPIGSDEDWYKQLKLAISNGILWQELNQAECTAVGGLVVEVDTYVAWIGGVHTTSNAVVSKTASANGSGNARRDRIVLRLQRSTKFCEPVLKTGIPASSPAFPDLTVTDDIIEIPLCKWKVAAGTSTISEFEMDRVFTGDSGWFDFTATWSVFAGSDFSISGQVPHVARARHVGMQTTIFILADVAVYNSTNSSAVNGTVQVSLNWPALYDSVPLANDFHGDTYRVRTHASTSGFIDILSINPGPNKTFISDGVARSVSITGTYQLRPF